MSDQDFVAKFDRFKKDLVSEKRARINRYADRQIDLKKERDSTDETNKVPDDLDAYRRNYERTFGHK